jgi:hypothetical protein
MLMNQYTMFYSLNHSLLQKKLVLQQWLLPWCGPSTSSLPTSFYSPLPMTIIWPLCLSSPTLQNYR